MIGFLQHYGLALLCLWLGAIIGFAIGWVAFTRHLWYPPDVPLAAHEPNVGALDSKRNTAPVNVGVGVGVQQIPATLQPPIFHATTGAIAPRNVWAEEHGKIMNADGPLEVPHEEQAPMFLDQFLLRYFYELMQPIDETARGRPWPLFVERNPWAKEMPLLFYQLTTIRLTDMQLNGAIAEYMSRVGKLNAS